ncbi:MAG: hypothetical protein DI628_01250 [Blastochloris viridis]|uniref:Uncharacterized protein n=1 Tax=Blastochloris viridis TaxID=1079 RepID=A0A6N4RB89_BLAVI|nr:MAG: hypothetical protein DI628_01250 [Blastochloris viridis]
MTQFAEVKNLRPVKACLRNSLVGKTATVQASIDNAGKTNAGSEVGSGNFLSGSQTASFVVPTLKNELGMNVQDLMNMSGEFEYRRYLPQSEIAKREAAFAKVKSNFLIDVAPLSLDFTESADISGMIKGLGLYSNFYAATVSGGARVKTNDGSHMVEGAGGMKMKVFSRKDGGMIGRVWGNTLVTGEGGVGMQQPLQLWSGEFVANVSLLDALVNMHSVPKVCSDMFDKVIGREELTI